MGEDYYYDLGLKGLSPTEAVKEIDKLKEPLVFAERTVAYYFTENTSDFKNILIKIKHILPGMKIITADRHLETGNIPVDVYKKLFLIFGKGKGLLSFPIGFVGLRGSKLDIWGDIWIYINKGKANIEIHKSRGYTNEELAEIKSKTGLKVTLRDKL